MDALNRDLQVLASVAEELKRSYIREGAIDPWAGSPFAWIRTLPSRRVGKIGEQLVSGWCIANGLRVAPSPDAQADRIIEGHRVEIKFSTLWESGVYTFQQFRDQDYEYAICLGLSPFDAHCWVVRKNLIMAYAPPQHTGRAGTETRWLTFSPLNPPAWMADAGGSLEHALRVLTSLRQH